MFMRSALLALVFALASLAATLTPSVAEAAETCTPGCNQGSSNTGSACCWTCNGGTAQVTCDNPDGPERCYLVVGGAVRNAYCSTFNPYGPVIRAPWTNALDPGPGIKVSPSNMPTLATPGPGPTKPAKEVLAAGGTFRFILKASKDALASVEAVCAKNSKLAPGGPDSAAAVTAIETCLVQAFKTAAGQGIRFEKAPDKSTSWVSFGTEQGKEVVSLKARLKVVSSDQTTVIVDLESKLAGASATELAAATPNKMTLTFHDDTTVSISPLPSPGPGKGVRVYKRVK